MMNGLLLLALWLVPLLLVPLAIRGNGGVWPILAALPALVAALLLPDGAQIEIPWLLLGVQLGLDAQSRIFLLIAALLWLVAACYARAWLGDDRPAGRFCLFFLLAMSGNFGVIVGQDLVSFYLGFSVMGLATYGLVVHGGQPQQRWAGKVYLAMTLLGELVLFAAFVLIYQRTGTLAPDMEQLVGGGPWEVGLLILAFAIKAGVVGVHFWLPLAYSTAPLPATAVMSGAMSKTALIGWLRFLPLGQQAMLEWGAGLVIVGSVAALLAIPAGLVQRDPKAVLAYSSIGKMGLMVAALGLALREPTLAGGLIAAVVLFAAHHSLAKGALFLGIGLVKNTLSRWTLWLVALPALALAGAPFTSGGLAKAQLSEALSEGDVLWGNGMLWLLVVAAIGTPLLMARFLYLLNCVPRNPIARPRWQLVPWLILVTMMLLLPLIEGDLSATWSDPWLLIALVVAAVIWWRCPDPLARWVGAIPPGDVLVPLYCGWQKVVELVKGRAQVAGNQLSRMSILKMERIQLKGGRLRGLLLLAGRAGFGSLWLGVTLIFLLLTVWS